MKKSAKQKDGIGRSLRSKVMMGFLCLVVLLIFSSVVSLLELRHIGQQTKTILTASDNSMTLASELLDAIEEQNRAMHPMFLNDNMSYDSVYSHQVAVLTSLISQARQEEVVGIDSIEIAYEKYTETTQFYQIHKAINDTSWYSESYAVAYHNLITAIREYMHSSQVALGPQAMAIRQNAYRAITPSVVTIGAILIIVLMLWYFLDMYGVKTVTKVNRSLGDYLQYKIPYNVKLNGNDEIEQLSGRIEELINRTEELEKKQK